jgi:hypothetical protein
MLCTYDIRGFLASQVIAGKNENDFSTTNGLINTGIGQLLFTNKKTHSNQPVAKWNTSWLLNHDEQSFG